jgi:AraC-like DNA-binding protein
MARPLKEINWDYVEKLIECGCSGIEIASKFRIQSNTFYERFYKEYGCSFQDYRADAQECGLADLRAALHSKALKGCSPVLIFLARCRLGMKEPDGANATPANQSQIDQSHLIMQLQHQLEELKKDADKSKTEQELLRSDSSF